MSNIVYKVMTSRISVFEEVEKESYGINGFEGGKLAVAIADISPDRSEVEEFVKEIRESGNTFIPGDLEVKRIAENEKNGLEIDEKLYETLKTICDKENIDLDSYLTE